MTSASRVLVQDAQPHIGSLDNSTAAIQARVQSGKLSLTLPIVILPARTLLFALVQVLVAAGAQVAGSANPWQSAIQWWPVHMVATNIIMLFVLSRLARAEGIQLRDLTNFDHRRLGRDLLLSVGFAVIGFPVALLGIIASTTLIYGQQIPEMFFPLPIWAAAFALVALPLSNASAETTTYLGYALPRLEVLLRSKWVALFLVAFWLAFQHVALPLMVDGQYLLWRFVSMLPMALVVGALYLWKRRLFPLMVAHFVMDFQLALTIFSLAAV